MKGRLGQDIVLRADEFGGIAYVPSRDDFFAVDEQVFGFLRSFERQSWTMVGEDEREAVVSLAGLDLLQTEPRTPSRAYSGPSFIGAFKDIVTLSEPLVLNCFATAHCPLKCLYCHADDLMSDETRRDEDREGGTEVANVIATARMVNSIVAVITGGDPLTRPERAQRVIGALSGHKALVLDTSGVAQPEVIERFLPFLKEHKVHVRVSLDSPDSRVQEKVRPSNREYAAGLSSYHGAVSTIRACLDIGIPVTVQTVVSRVTDTSEKLLPLRDFLIELGVRHWVLHLAVEAGAARKIQSRVKGSRGGILPQPSARANVWRVVKSTLADGLPIDIRVTDNTNTPNSVLLLSSNGALYTEGLAHKGKVQLFDPEEGRPDLLRKLFFYIDNFGHARRYLNWNPEMFDGRNLESLCVPVEVPRRGREAVTVLVEQERKYSIADEEALIGSLQGLSYYLEGDDLLEDRYYDTADGSLARNDFVLRVRRKNEVFLFAEKGPRFRRTDGEYDRVEVEFPLTNVDALEESLVGRGLRVTWRLVRRRLTFSGGPGSPGVVVDRLAKVGSFLEMEGKSGELARLAGELRGLGRQETRNYREIIEDWCRGRGIQGREVYGLDQNDVLSR
ncbi:MAG: CYTH domain-containing protein [Candidatus Rokubacteria bacterium]|nr:CYTH domain-containing protein [Candidatus Rokubacteria bacterium]